MVTINRLSMRGFKSFGHKTEIAFGKKFNMIIGANGSGKTNISDSITFVLGRMSAKDMRAERSANLIFNGGKKGSPAKEAEVTLEFDNSTGKFSIQSKEVLITRIVKQNGTSVYKINDEVRTRQQVVDLLNSAKIDPNGHNIIMQGDIVSMAEMKPVERREIIEEIAGISVYEEKKQKCLNELQKVDARLNEAEIILTERAANLRELKKERDEAVKYKELQEAIRDDKGTYLHLQIKEKQEKIDEIEKTRKEIEDRLKEINNGINELRKNAQSSKEEIKKINDDIEVKGEKDQFILRKEIDELKTAIVKANSRLDVCSSEVERIKSRRQQLISNLKEIDEKTKGLKSERQKLEHEVRKTEAEEKILQKELNIFREKHGIDTDINKTLDDIEKNAEGILENIYKTNEDKQSLVRNRDQLVFKLNAIEDRLNAIKGSKDDLESLKNFRKKLKETADNLSKSLGENTSYSAQLGKNRKEFYDCSEELARLKTRQIGVQEAALGDLAVRKILELGKSIKGIHGTARSLGKVDSKYSIAMEVAVGARANSLIVDSDLTAQKCIEYLKNNKSGIATFLPINKIKPRVQDQRVVSSEKGVYGFANDLVKYDPKYKDVFSYLLGSTVVVEDIQTARKIGIGRTRMVTLEGDLMEPSGAMIGGYRTRREGLGFKEADIDEKAEKLEEKTKELKKLIEHIESKKAENEDSIARLKGEKANLEVEIIKLEKTLDLEGSETLLEERKELADKIKIQDKEISNIEDKLASLNKQLSEIKSRKLKAKEKLADKGLAKDLGSINEQRINLRERFLDFQAGIKNIDTQIETIMLPEKERTEKILKQQDKEFEDFTRESNDLKEIIKARNSELKEEEQEEKKFHSNFKDLITKRNKLNEGVQKLETNIAREEERIKSHEHRLNNINIDIAKHIAEREGIEKEFEEFKDAKIKRGISLEDLKVRIKSNEKSLSQIGNVNLRALEVYDQIQEEYGKIVGKVDKLKGEKEDVLNMMTEVESKKAEIFMKTYNNFIKNFKDIFNQLTTKGEAHVVLENKDNPFEGGVDIQIRVAGNKFLDMRSLSGGEKTLAALAFIFAIQDYSPSPFYLLDEVDAALDKKNSELLSKLIQKYSDKAQYVVISHNDNVITEAENIYGVSMQEGISKVISLKI